MSPGRRPRPILVKTGHKSPIATITSPRMIRKRDMTVVLQPVLWSRRRPDQGARYCQGKGQPGVDRAIVAPLKKYRDCKTTPWEDSMKRTLLLGAALALAFGAGIATQS